MFKRISRSIDGLRLEMNAMTKAVRLASERFQESGGTEALSERVSALEGRIQSILGEVDGALTRAQSLKSAARASEERERNHAKRAEGFLEAARAADGSSETDPFEQAGRAWQDQLAEGNDGEDGGLSPVPSSVEGRRDGRELAKAAKRR